MEHSIGSRCARRHRGIAFAWAFFACAGAISLVSIGVDVGKVQVAKAELQQAADAAARYGAAGLKNILNGQSAAASNAVKAASENTVDGAPVVLDPSTDVSLVVWNKTQKTYVKTTDATLANGVLVSPVRSKARGNPVPLVFGPLVGLSSCDIKAVSSIALLTPGVAKTFTIPATQNPFLAGMPKGSVASNNNPHKNPDYAGDSTNKKQSPTQTSGIPIVGGDTLTFDGINGGATNDLNDPARYSADGNLAQIVNNSNGSENGIADMHAPMNCLMGVFLNDDAPTSGATPTSLDFTTQSQRDFTTLSPDLKQTFFIGDGRDSTGVVQQFVVPQGATRLFITTWDSYEWNNNVGTFSFTMHAPGSVTLVH